MEAIQDRTVGEIVTDNIKAADVFKKHGIDFCCRGGVSIKEACDSLNIDHAIIEAELAILDTKVDRALDYDSWKLDFLADHIVNVHHGYIEKSNPVLMQYSQRVNLVHGSKHPELAEIETLVKEVVQEMAAHMKKEELILFPFIKKLAIAERDGTEVPPVHFGTVENPINMMEAEHEHAGDIMRTIAKLSNNYTPPEGACNTYRAFYDKLDEFEQDLHLHVHLENNILFPKALKLEKNLKKA